MMKVKLGKYKHKKVSRKVEVTYVGSDLIVFVEFGCEKSLPVNDFLYFYEYCSPMVKYYRVYFETGITEAYGKNKKIHSAIYSEYSLKSFKKSILKKEFIFELPENEVKYV